MKRTTQVIAALGVCLAAPALAYVRDGSYFDYARVERVDRIVATADRPQTREECWNEPRAVYHPGTGYRRDTIERDGDDEDAPVIRHDVVESNGYSTTEMQRVCRTQTENLPAQQTVAFDVVYRYRGQDYHDRLDHDPGRSIRVHVDHGYVEAAE